MKYIDRTGQKFWSWTVVSRQGCDATGRALWLIRCDCGFEKLRIIGNITHGDSKQCNNCRTKEKTGEDYTEEFPETLWRRIPYQAENRGIVFKVSKKYVYSLFLAQNRKCKLTGLDIRFASSPKDYAKGNQTASLDRIDSNLGYTKDNIQWVHKEVNMMKKNISEDRLLELSKLIVNNSLRNGEVPNE